jgi:hypothetical protein
MERLTTIFWGQDDNIHFSTGIKREKSFLLKNGSNTSQKFLDLTAREFGSGSTSPEEVNARARAPDGPMRSVQHFREAGKINMVSIDKLD